MHERDPISITGAVMAGGQSRRLGRDKALLEVGGETLLARAVRTISAVCDEVMIVGPAERASLAPGLRVVPDERPGAGPLGGIATALRAMRGGYLLAVATDMPFLSVDLLRALIRRAPDHDVVIPRVEGRTQQLHAIYSRACLPAIDAQLARDDFKIDRFFALVDVHIMEEDEVRQIDPELRSFRNINTEEEWASLREMLT